MNKQVDMSAFVGKGFDCEFLDQFGDWNNVFLLHKYNENESGVFCYSEPTKTVHWRSVRPRLNKPQVIDDWSWIPDGLVWDVFGDGGDSMKVCGSERFREIDALHPYQFSTCYATCIGVEPDYAEWGKARDMAVID